MYGIGELGQSLDTTEKKEYKNAVFQKTAKMEKNREQRTFIRKCSTNEDKEKVSGIGF